MAKNKKLFRKKITKKYLIILVLGLFLSMAAWATWFIAILINRYEQAYNQASQVNIREMVLLAVEGQRNEAPVKPETGDIYFPEARLYMPNPTLNTVNKGLLYLYESESEFGVEALNITTSAIMGLAKSKLYTGTKVDDVLNAVPYLQACSRGYKLTYIPISADQKQDAQRLISEFILNNGKKMFVYVDSGCKELEDETFKIDFSTLKAY